MKQVNKITTSEKIHSRLQLLDKPQLNLLYKYITLYTKSKHPVIVINTILKHQSKVNNSIIHQALYGSMPFNDARIRVTLSRTLTIIDRFILETHNSISNKKIKVIKDFKLHVQDFTNMKKMEPELLFDSENHQFDLQLLDAIEQMEYIESKNNRAAEPNFQNVMDGIDHKYILDKLKIACAAANFANLNSFKYDYGIVESALPLLQEKINTKHPILYLYLHTFLFLKDKSDAHFKKVFQYIHKHKISRTDEMIQIFTMTINYCIQKLNKGDKSQAGILLQLYKKQIESKCIYDNLGLISPHAYQNIIIIALNQKDYKWTLSFIESNKSKLPKNSRNEIYLLAKARWAYEQEQYQDCIQFLMMSKPIDPLANLTMRTLQVKAFFMLDDYDAVDSTIQNAKLFLLRLRSNAYQMMMFKNFYAIVSKIMKTPQNKLQREQLKAMIQQKPTAEKAWLIEII